MKHIAIIGAGQSAYELFPEKTLRYLFGEVARDAYTSVDKGFHLSQMEEAFIGTLGTGGSQLGNFAPLMAEAEGMIGVPATHVENACASSGFALRAAILAIASGRISVAVADGVEKMSDLPRERNRLWLGISCDVEWVRLAGTFPRIYAMMARRHMHEFGTRKEDITSVAIKYRANATHNPKAQFRVALVPQKAQTASNLAAPFSLADVCGLTHGASLIILCDVNRAGEFTDHPVEIVAYGAATDYVANDRPTMTKLAATRRAAQVAYEMVGIAPEEISFAEVHGCFTIEQEGIVRYAIKFAPGENIYG